MSNPPELDQAALEASPSRPRSARRAVSAGLFRHLSFKALHLAQRYSLVQRVVRRLHPLVSTIHRSGLFDADWYLARYPDVSASGVDPLNHYVEHGLEEERFPNPLFDGAWYLANNDDVRASGSNPLRHYIRSGEAEGRRPNPLFDPRWYRARYADVADLSPLRHYLAHGSVEFRSPSEAFDPIAYFRANPDLEGVVPDPLAHYLHHGRSEGRSPGDPVGSAFRRGRGGIGFAVADGASRGRYTLSNQVSGYAYIPPRKPRDFDALRASLGRSPSFSIVTPVYNVAPQFIQSLVLSVRAQWYDRWELILVDDASTRPETSDFLRVLQNSAMADARIKFSYRKVNGGIAEATNTALSLCRGDYVVFLDHDDELTEDCLYELAKAISNTNADYLYSDEDKVDERGAFSSPFYKPDWSPDALMSTMYTCHVSCVRRSLLEEVGGLRQGFDGAQDYDLILRVTERASGIIHIPRVLYHWRTLESSIARAMEAKPAATDAAASAKRDALKRRGLQADIETVPSMPGQHHIRYKVRGAPKVSVLIPSKDNIDYLSPCIASLMESAPDETLEIIVVDNGSVDPITLNFLDSLAFQPGIRVMQDCKPFNFSSINNLAASAASGAYLLFLNDDIVAPPTDWIARMVGYAQLTHVGAVGAKLLYPDGAIQHAGILNLNDGPGHAFLNRPSSTPLYFGRNVLEYNWLAVTAACMMVSRQKFQAVGGFDENFPVAYNDVELCFRLHKMGYYNVVVNAIQLIHHESVSRGYDVDPVRAKRLQDDWRRLYRKHPDLYMYDPFHNQNLDPKDVHFGE